MKAQGIDRRTLPFRSWYQPWLAIIGGSLAFVMIFVSSYEVFEPGQWDVKSFLFTYLFVFINIGIFVGVKLIKRTKWKNAKDVDLVTGLKEVELYEEEFYLQAARDREIKEDGQIKMKWHEKFFTFIFGSEL